MVKAMRIVVVCRSDRGGARAVFFARIRVVFDRLAIPKKRQRRQNQATECRACAAAFFGAGRQINAMRVGEECFARQGMCGRKARAGKSGFALIVAARLKLV